MGEVIRQTAALLHIIRAYEHEQQHRVKIAYVVNEASFFISHRLPLAQEASRLGFDVVILCGSGTGEEALAAHNLQWRTYPLSRSGVNPLEEIRTLAALIKIYRTERPDLVHHVTIKPVIYGTLAARWSGVPAVVNAVPGLGFVFTRRGLIASIGRTLVNLMYRVSLSHPNMRVIFQNTDDMRAFITSAIVDRAHATLIRGAGVDLTAFRHLPEPPEPITFLLATRMLRHKGVAEYVAAARETKIRYPQWRFQLAGDVDAGNPASLSREQLLAWAESGDVEWLGYRDDVADLMAKSHVAVLPSYYREGLPKALLEAAASGRAMIATDIAGCREVVRDKVTGIIVPPRDAESLQSAMIRLGTDAEFRQRCGEASRKMAEALFSVEDVVRDTFLVYDQLAPA